MRLMITVTMINGSTDEDNQSKNDEIMKMTVIMIIITMTAIIILLMIRF